MSDTETEDLSVDIIVEYIRNAVKELRETNDFLSYATVLDVNLQNPERFSDEEKIVILDALNGVLIENVDIVEEIGWDIPALVLPFLELDWDLDEESDVGPDTIKSVMRVFDTVAKRGNAKELFIKSIELLGDLDYTDCGVAKREKIMDCKFYALLELLASSLKRINTVYPSKFLAMALTCLLVCFTKYITSNPHQRFISRKLYAFARDYIPPMRPLDWLEKHNLTQFEASKLDDDENFLQRKLLQSFLTQLVGLSFRKFGLGYGQQLFSEMKMKEVGKVPILRHPEFDGMTSTREVFNRMVMLGMSFDINFEDEMVKLADDSAKLVQKAIEVVKEKRAEKDGDKENEQDQLIQATVSLCLNDRISGVYHAEQKSLPVSPVGILNLCVIYSYDERTHGNTPDMKSVSLLETMSMHIRFFTPALLSQQFWTKGIVDSMIYWDLLAINRATPDDFKAIPNYVKILFLQTTIHFSCTDPEPEYRFILFTLLVRVLANMEEDEAYGFIIDTLTTAPLDTAKAGVLNVLKDFLIRERTSVDDLSEQFEKVSVKENGDKTEAKPKPALPKRHFIELTQDRTDDIYALIRECLDETFATAVIEGGRFKVLLGFLNLLIGIKERFPQEYLSEIVSITKKKLDMGKACDDESTNVEFATIAVDILMDYIRHQKEKRSSSS